MKKFIKISIVLVTVFFVHDLFSQGAYINVNVGYGLAFSTSTSWDCYNYTGTDNSSTYEQVYLSLGKGFNFGGTFGYMFNEHVGAELGVSYLIGGKTVCEESDNDEWGSDLYKTTFSAKMLRFIPAIVVAAGTEGVNPYAKFGIVIGTGSVTHEGDYTSTYNDMGLKTTHNYLNVWKYKGGVAMGIQGAVGALFELSDKLSFFAELNTINMSYAPTKGERTEAKDDGVDQLPDMTTRQKEIEFVKEYTYNHDSEPPDSEPDQELKQKMPFGSFGINAGLIINL